MLDFWREKIGMGETDGIGFWNDRENVENHFAEMGAVASLTQEETKKDFWQETAESVLEEATEGELFFAEKKKPVQKEEANPQEKRRTARLLTAEMFRLEQEDAVEEERLGQVFLWETPGMEEEKRSIVPVMEEVVQEEEKTEKKAEESPEREKIKKEGQQVESEIDIEKLMRQMTKKLWEERESCGRRLR